MKACTQENPACEHNNQDYQCDCSWDGTYLGKAESETCSGTGCIHACYKTYNLNCREGPM
ncbi:unnamed protein product, partial [Rotaria magnacalcarata]